MRRVFGLVMVTALAVLTAVGLAGCNKSHKAYALTSTGKLLQFATDKPGTISNSVSISGLSSGTSIVQLDYRPADGKLYGVTSDQQLALIDTGNGDATLIGSGAFTSSSLSSAVADFDPAADELRVMATDQNLLVYPDTATLASSGTAAAYISTDTNQGKTPDLVGIAYDHNTSGASTTTLYALDQTTHSLVRVGSAGGSPNSASGGLLYTIGTLGVTFGSNAGFDISSDGTAYALLAPSGSGASLYTINLGTGAATKVGQLDQGNRSIIALAVAP